MAVVVVVPSLFLFLFLFLSFFVDISSLIEVVCKSTIELTVLIVRFEYWRLEEMLERCVSKRNFYVWFELSMNSSLIEDWLTKSRASDQRLAVVLK